MIDHTYSEAGIRGQRDFAIAGCTLKITGKNGFSTFNLNVDLSDVAPNFERVKCFNHGALRRATIYLVVVGVVSLLISAQRLLPSVAVGLVALLVALPGIVTLIRFSRLIEVEQFRSRTAGVVVFDLIREKRKGAEFDRFIEILRTAVLKAQQEQAPNKAPEPTPGAVTPRATGGDSK